MKNPITILIIILAFLSCKQNTRENVIGEVEVEKEVGKAQVDPDSIAKDLKDKGYEIFNYKDEALDTTFIMQQYYIVFLKAGTVKSENKEEGDSIMKLHLKHLSRMYEEGYASVSGPFGDDGEIRGITIYNTPTLKKADSLAQMDPMVTSGRLIVETHPWWAAKGMPLR